MFNPFLNIAKLSAQYVLSYWTSQVNYTMFIKLILYFDQEWKHKSQWDQVLLLSQLLFLTLHRWGQENQTKTKTLTAKIFRLHREERKLNADELLKFLESYIWFCSGFSVVIIEIMLTLNRLWPSLLQCVIYSNGWMSATAVVPGIWFPPCGVQWCSEYLDSVKFQSSLPKRHDTWTWCSWIKTWVMIPMCFFCLFVCFLLKSVIISLA